MRSGFVEDIRIECLRNWAGVLPLSVTSANVNRTLSRSSVTEPSKSNGSAAKILRPSPRITRAMCSKTSSSG